ncbi:arylesterase [Thiobacillus sp.]|uniref:arylesterase n=1 Tax=Thiobacillus sp. TaxID=924 RepID=UPI0025E80455|nr:arylesterase [Thiobacillus sp.]MBT9539712.1 arylesterase [Thiobacillus sp.]
MTRAIQRALFALFALLLLAACDRAPTLPKLGPHDVILAFGDSLTYGTGAAPSEAYPAQLVGLTQRAVVNAGVPGETTAEGLKRLPALLDEHRPKLVLLCLGGNDMLRRLPEAETENNLRLMLQTLRASGIQVVLIGVPEPKLFGGAPDFYAQLAEEFELPYDGDTLNAVLKDNALKSDPIHPNAAGYQTIARQLADLLKESGAL